MAMGNPAQDKLIVCTAGDGTLGYSDGTKYFPLYCRLQQVSEVTPITVRRCRESKTTTRLYVGMEYMRLDHVSEGGHTYEESCPMENLLFKYQTADLPTEIVEEEGWNVRVLPPEVEVEYVQEAWKKGYGVRRLFANALRGRGAMLASNKGRVYVLDSSIPHEHEMVSRGYLKVDGSAMMEHFLEGMHWASRCEGVRSMPTKTGEKVPTFVIKDRTSHPTTGYYVVCTKSRLPNRLICHLEPIGRTLDRMRKVVWHTGDSELGLWAHRVHGAQSFLFD